MAEDTEAIDRDEETEEEFQLLSSISKDSAKPIDLIDNYIPASDDWGAKTVIGANDPQRVATLRILSMLYDEEIGHLDQPLNEFLDTYLKVVTSVNGMSRDEYLAILKRLAGGGSGDDGPDRSGILDTILTPPSNGSDD